MMQDEEEKNEEEYMKIIKRSGSEVSFDIQKIEAAIKAAFWGRRTRRSGSGHS